jgi:hypothetical protein
MSGGFQGYGMGDVILEQGVETMIRGLVYEVGDILDTTDHAADHSPYSRPRRSSRGNPKGGSG